MTPLVLVVDASVAVKVYLKEGVTAEGKLPFSFLNDPANPFPWPHFFFPECANIFWKQVKRGIITSAQAVQYLARVDTWALIRTATSSLCQPALDLALSHNISAYDACYVALAHQENVELISADQKLVAKMA